MELSSVRLWAGMIGIALSMSGGAWAVDPPTPPPSVAKLSAVACASFVEEVTADTLEDVALERFLLKAMTDIYSVVGVPELSPGQMLANIEEANLRGDAFLLEGIARAMEATDPIGFATVRDKATLFENAIGDYELQKEMLKYLRKGENGKYAELLKKAPTVEAMFRGRILGAGDSVLVNQKRWGFVGKDSVYKQMMDALYGKDAIKRFAKNSGLKPEEAKRLLTKNKYLKKNLLEWAAGKCESIHKQMERGLKLRDLSPEELAEFKKQGKAALDPDEIEEGTHKGKRLIRSVAGLFKSFDGLFELDQSLKIEGISLAPAEKRPVLNASKAEMKKNPAAISQDGFYYMDELVRHLDELKSNDGMRENVYNALKAASHDLGGAADDLLKALEPPAAVAGESPFKATHDATRAIFQSTVESKFFLQMAEQLRKAAKGFK